MPPTKQAQLKIGLRFDRRDTAKLLVLAERAKLRELDENTVSTFALAAEAARTGEPLIVVCNSRVEVALMAAGYTRYGCRQPVIDTLSR